MFSKRHKNVVLRLLAIVASCWFFTGHAQEIPNDHVIDQRTSYIWKRCAEGMTWTGKTCSGEALLLSVNDVAHYLDRLHQKPKQSWRLPDVKELITIIDYNKITPAIDSDLFPNTPSKIFLSSTKLMGQENQFWGVFFKNGAVIPYDPYDFDNKPMRFAIRLIRTK